MTEVVPTHRREHISFSQLATAARCGEEFRLKYIVGVPSDTVNIPALVGSAFHAAVEQFEMSGLSPIFDDDVNRLNKLTKYYVRKQMDDHSLRQDDLIQYGKQDLNFYYTERIPQVTESYLTRRYQEQQDGFRFYNDDPETYSELICEVEINGHKTLAAIDQVMQDSSGRVVIRDLKTGEPRAKDAMQMEFYRLALKYETGIEADYGQLLYVKRKKPKIEVVKFMLNDEHVAILSNRLLNAIEHESFLVTGPINGHCSTCSFASICEFSKVGTRGIA